MTTRQRKEEFIKAYIYHMCNVSRACEVSKVSRATYYYWFKTDKAFADALNETDESFHDTVEGVVREHIKTLKGTQVFPWVKYWLEHKAQHRGWTPDRGVTEHTGSVKLEINERVIPDRGKQHA